MNQVSWYEIFALLLLNFAFFCYSVGVLDCRFSYAGELENLLVTSNLIDVAWAN